MGYSFTYPVFALLGGAVVATYTHYPTISSDMLKKVTAGESSFNNDVGVSKSGFLTKIKVLYSFFHAFSPSEDVSLTGTIIFSFFCIESWDISPLLFSQILRGQGTTSLLCGRGAMCQLCFLLLTAQILKDFRWKESTRRFLPQSPLFSILPPTSLSLSHHLSLSFLPFWWISPNSSEVPKSSPWLNFDLKRITSCNYSPFIDFWRRLERRMFTSQWLALFEKRIKEM